MMLTSESTESEFVYIASKDQYNNPCIVQVRPMEHQDLVRRMVEKNRVFTTYAEARTVAKRIAKSIKRGL